jgi:hypothetical protein
VHDEPFLSKSLCPLLSSTVYRGATASYFPGGFTPNPFPKDDYSVTKKKGQRQQPSPLHPPQHAPGSLRHLLKDSLVFTYLNECCNDLAIDDWATKHSPVLHIIIPEKREEIHMKAVRILSQWSHYDLCISVFSHERGSFIKIFTIRDKLDVNYQQKQSKVDGICLIPIFSNEFLRLF